MDSTPANPLTPRAADCFVGLAQVDDRWAGLVGGKAVGLARMIRAGERVPAGFCVTTAAHEAALVFGALGSDLRGEILRAYQRLGSGAVAVRSSATAEDLPYARFAGQHETVLNVRGADELIDAVQRCWDSLTSAGALAYREAAGTVAGPVRMGVVVQRMVDPAAAGVLFTANPITGCRTEMVIDAVAGLGDVVVDSSVIADHYVLAGRRPVTAGGCLDPVRLWLLQSRPITTLFPVPNSTRPGPRAYLEVGHMQGMLRPFTPMGMAAMRVATALYFQSVGVAADPFTGHPGVVDAAGRM